MDDELAATADTFDENYTQHGWHQGGMVHIFQKSKENSTQYPKSNVGTERHPTPASSTSFCQLYTVGGYGTAGGLVTAAHSGLSGSNTQRKCWLCLPQSHRRKDYVETNKTNNMGR